MFKRVTLYLSLALIALLGSCAFVAAPGAEGEVRIVFGPERNARALADAPMSELPVLSSVRITISGPGMDPVTFTVDGDQGSFTAMVPGGDARRVELYAPVDWAATQTLYPAAAAELPTLVKAYGAVSTVNVVPGQRVSAVLKLGVVETKILLPDGAYGIGPLMVADTLDSTPVNASVALNVWSNADYEFDRLGRLIIANMNAGAMVRARNPADANPYPLSLYVDHLAYDRGIDRLYSMLDDGGSLNGTDFLVDPPTSFSVNVPPDYSFGFGSVAVDETGLVYISAWYSPTETEGILKLRVLSPSGSLADSQALAFASFDSLGIGNTVELRELMVQDDHLYGLFGENQFFSVPHRGKLVEISLEDLGKVRELGWSDTDYPSSPSTQFYGPKRFIALAPRKLIIADEGSNGSTDVDRVVEVDLDEWIISGIGQNGAVSFFSGYAC